MCGHPKGGCHLRKRTPPQWRLLQKYPPPACPARETPSRLAAGKRHPSLDSTVAPGWYDTPATTEWTRSTAQLKQRPFVKLQSESESTTLWLSLNFYSNSTGTWKYTGATSTIFFLSLLVSYVTSHWGKILLYCRPITHTKWICKWINIFVALCTVSCPIHYIIPSLIVRPWLMTWSIIVARISSGTAWCLRAPRPLPPIPPPHTLTPPPLLLPRADSCHCSFTWPGDSMFRNCTVPAWSSSIYTCLAAFTVMDSTCQVQVLNILFDWSSETNSNSSFVSQVLVAPDCQLL